MDSTNNMQSYSFLISLIVIIDIIILAVVISKLFWHAKNKKKHTENYYNILPYPYMWNVYSCYSMPCTKEESYKCYKWCNFWEEPGARQECWLNCLNIGDIQSDVIKYNDYNWSVIQPKLAQYSMINKTDDYVE